MPRWTTFPGATGCSCHGFERPDPLRQGCQCEACQALRVEIEADGIEDDHLGAHLLIRGWAGGYTNAERAYRKAHGYSAPGAPANLVNYRG